jgi:hypothetical protein
LVLAAVYSSYLYYVHLPRFFSEIFTAIYGPHIGTAIYATIIALVATAFFFWANRVSAKFKTLTSNWLGERNLNKVLWLSCALLLAFATYKVLFTSDWGEYNPEQFGVSDELDERFTRTGLLFIFSSFGLLVFCISRSRTSFQNLLLALCGISLAVILMRNPAIPIPYFYERYWWSEFGLILLLIAADSMNRNSLGVIGKNMTSAAVMISLAFNLTYFDFSISREVEGGIDGKFTVILEKLKSLGYSQLYFKSDEDIWWLSGFVVPLRYTYGIKVSDQRALAHAEKLDTPYVTQLGCGSDKELLNLNFSIDRLRRFSSIDTLGWVENGTSIFMCKSLQ